jgi:hypothetical protein
MLRKNVAEDIIVHKGPRKLLIHCFCLLRLESQTFHLELEAGVGDWLIRELELVVLCCRCHTGVFLVVAVVFLENTVGTFVDFCLLVRLQKLDFVQA